MKCRSGHHIQHFYGLTFPGQKNKSFPEPADRKMRMVMGREQICERIADMRFL